MLMKWVMSLVLAAFLGLSSETATAGPKEEAVASLQTWVAAFNASDVDAVTPAYLPDATVHGVLSSSLIEDEAALRRYLGDMFKIRARVLLGETSAVQISDETVLLTGYCEYGVTPPIEQSTTIPARFSFVMVKRDGYWKIAHQHASSRRRPQ